MSTDTVNSIFRIMDLLECFAQSNGEWSLTALSQKLSLPPSTTHRLLNTLVQQGYIKQEKNEKTYKTGDKLIWFACAIASKYDLRSVSWGKLQSLSKMVQETIHLCQLDGFYMFYVDKIESSQSIICKSIVGSHIPAHCASAGKVLLAYQSASFIERYCQMLPSMPIFTPNTITSPSRLREVLADVRRSGYALDNEEVEQGLICIAAPIFDSHNQINASISISGPSFRVRDNIETYIPLLRSTAQEISAMIGGNKPASE